MPPASRGRRRGTGAGGAGRAAGLPEINGLLVRPESLRSQGIGTALVHTAERLARERGIGGVRHEQADACVFLVKAL